MDPEGTRKEKELSHFKAIHLKRKNRSYVMKKALKKEGHRGRLSTIRKKREGCCRGSEGKGG